MKGAVAAGSGLTAEAGAWALRAGGNAVDAAIAATLMAGVAEPLLTGIGGAGLATIRFGGEVYTCDFFSNMPGTADPAAEPASMDSVSINYGPTTQGFLVGPGSAAVPGVPAGLSALSDRFGVLPMETLVQPAIQAAVDGAEVTPGFERVCELLWPILARSDKLRLLFAPNGERLRAGDTFYCPELARTLEAFGDDPHYFKTGGGARALVSHLDGQTLISAQDLEQQEAQIRRAIPVKYRDATVWVPGAPSAAGVGIAHTLAALEASTPDAEPTGLSIIRRLEEALSATVNLRGKPFLRDLFTEGFEASFVARVQAMRNPGGRASPGHTTHISTVDQSGNAVSITHSLGETSGETAGDTGVIINNFLGEFDVNPPFLRRPAGSRLITMCCPSIIELGDGRVVALGSGGSSRIPTAVLHGAIYMIDHGWSVSQAVRGPRTHVEDGKLHVESDGRTDATMQRLTAESPKFIRFDGPNMFFGGLHAVSVGSDGFAGHGDARRSGAFVEA